MTIIASADGSALGNPGPAGWAWYVDDNCWGAGGWKHATNNQAELKAVLELFRETAHRDDDLLVKCDSQYVINSITKWMRGWKAKGWRKADGKPVMNVELLKEIDEALTGRRYRFEWVKGHVGHELNEAADVRARAVAEAYQRGLEIPSGPGFTGGASASAPVPQNSSAQPADTAAAIQSGRAVTTPRNEQATFDIFGVDAPQVDEPTNYTVTVTLSRDEHERLQRAALRSGVSAEEALRRLI